MTNLVPQEPPVERQRPLRRLTLHFAPGFVAFYRTTPDGFVLDRLLSGCTVVGRGKKSQYVHPVTIPTCIAGGIDRPLASGIADKGVSDA